MNKYKAFATLLLSALGVFGAREFYKPRNIKDLLKWKGINLASDSRAWNSMFFEHEEELRSMKIENSDGLWAWCTEKFKVTNLNDEQAFNEAKKFCSDNPKSIMARIIRDGDDDKVIGKNDIDSFSINYLLAEDTKGILNLIGFKFKDEVKPPAKEVWSKFSEWCEGQKKVKINSKEDLDKFARFKKRCYGLGVKNVSALIEKQGKKLMIGRDKYKERWTKGKFQYAKELREELLKSLNTDQEEKKKFIHLINSSERQDKSRFVVEDDIKKPFEDYGWLLYERWCNQRLHKPLLDEGMLPHNYKKIFHRCAED